jgi:hypothetical protein
MKCLQVAEGVDVCVTVNVKLIYRKKKTDDIKLELIRNDAMRMAQHMGSREEAAMAAKIKDGLGEVDLGI